VIPVQSSNTGWIITKKEWAIHRAIEPSMDDSPGMSDFAQSSSKACTYNNCTGSGRGMGDTTNRLNKEPTITEQSLHQGISERNGRANAKSLAQTYIEG